LRALHGFSTRSGGRSLGPFTGLNLDDREDDPEIVAENRRSALSQLGFQGPLARLHQLHSAAVCLARPGLQRGDALVSAERGLGLVIATADCYPVLLEDCRAGVIAAVHAGWRGTLAGVVPAALAAMGRLGAAPDSISALVGPGISAERYPVGPEVASAFSGAGLGRYLLRCGGGVHLDLRGAISEQLLAGGVRRDRVLHLRRCTTSELFYSYRRDHGKTGRMWAVIAQ
jgi:YfiH family protein